MVSVDFFTVSTLAFQVLYVFIVLSHQRRKVLHFNVVEDPSAAWTAQQLREAFPFPDGLNASLIQCHVSCCHATTRLSNPAGARMDFAPVPLGGQWGSLTRAVPALCKSNHPITMSPRPCKPMITRRRFLRRAGVAASGVPVLAASTFPSLKALGYKSPNEKLNLASIGAGGQPYGDLRNAQAEVEPVLFDYPFVHLDQPLRFEQRSTTRKSTFLSLTLHA
jgi:hypothetical protein